MFKYGNYLNWTSTNIELKDKTYIITDMFQKPKNYKNMIQYSRLLSSGFAYCRVDFYEINGILYLSEITFTPFNAIVNFKNKETEIYLGNLINISKFDNDILKSL